MPRNGQMFPSPPQTAAELRSRAARLRQIAREFPADNTDEKLRELAREPEERATAMEQPITPSADP